MYYLDKNKKIFWKNKKLLGVELINFTLGLFLC